MKCIQRYAKFGGIPWFPELTSLGDSMATLIGNPKKLSCQKAFKQCSFESRFVKLQCVGPTTLKQFKKYRNSTDADIFNLISIYIESIKGALSTERVILFLDEPGMKNAQSGFEDHWEAIFENFYGVVRGVHICGDSAPWSDILRIPWLNIISLDVSLVDITIYPEYQQFRVRGGVIAHGTESEKSIRDWRLGDIITKPCGMSHLKYPDANLACEKAFNLLNFTSRKLNYLNR